MSLLRPRSPFLYVLPCFLSCEEHIACCQFRAAINWLASKCEFDLRGCCQQPAPQCAQRQGSPALSARQTFRVYRCRHWDQNRHRFLRLRRSVNAGQYRFRKSKFDFINSLPRFLLIHLAFDISTSAKCQFGTLEPPCWHFGILTPHPTATSIFLPLKATPYL